MARRISPLAHWAARERCGTRGTGPRWAALIACPPKSPHSQCPGPCHAVRVCEAVARLTRRQGSGTIMTLAARAAKDLVDYEPQGGASIWWKLGASLTPRYSRRPPPPRGYRLPQGHRHANDRCGHPAAAARRPRADHQGCRRVVTPSRVGLFDLGHPPHCRPLPAPSPAVLFVLNSIDPNDGMGMFSPKGRSPRSNSRTAGRRWQR